ncbi:replication protein A 70 kDa DNA-binding subunit E-like [Senna tora]|uniref:Replication protein A 70 kDa DNA-binding subunit E-like n=1 Tax=Senna tora TaxID=362788 RepID=A0A834TZZ8_9FABA|nr:replication protein A 70 kDa DNA-binding subunit E-like [Senna tora]
MRRDVNDPKRPSRNMMTQPSRILWKITSKVSIRIEIGGLSSDSSSCMGPYSFEDDLKLVQKNEATEKPRLQNILEVNEFIGGLHHEELASPIIKNLSNPAAHEAAFAEFPLSSIQDFYHTGDSSLFVVLAYVLKVNVERGCFKVELMILDDSGTTNVTIFYEDVEGFLGISAIDLRREHLQTVDDIRQMPEKFHRFLGQLFVFKIFVKMMNWNNSYSFTVQKMTSDHDLVEKFKRMAKSKDDTKNGDYSLQTVVSSPIDVGTVPDSLTTLGQTKAVTHLGLDACRLSFVALLSGRSFRDYEPYLSEKYNPKLVIECDFWNANFNSQETAVVDDDYKAEIVHPDSHSIEFAYDWPTDEFCITFLMSRGNVPNSSTLYSFSCKTRHWQVITQLEVHVGTFRESTVKMNERLFWLSSKTDVNKIVTFDISSKRCSIIVVPKLVEDAFVDLVRVQDRICLLTSKTNFDYSKDFIVWINNNLTTTNFPWTRHFRIPDAHRAFIPYSFINNSILCVPDETIETDIPFQDTTKYISLINDENKIMTKCIHCPNNLSFSVLRMFQYFPTLRIW